MKVSDYNIFIPLRGFVLVYNSFIDRFLGVSYEASSYLQSGNDGVALLKQNMPELYAELLNAGIIIDDDVDELEVLRENYNKAKYTDRRLYLMAYPSQDCNLKCWYCYESHKAGTRMSPNVIDSTVRYVKRCISANSFDRMQLGFFGGEPLLDFYMIAYPLAKNIQALCKKDNKSFSTFFVTNASLMNEDIVDKLGELNPYFQITLDGDKEKHDHVRIWKKDKKGTYDKIINSVKLLSERIPRPTDSDDPLITLRINYDNQTLKGMESVLDDLKDVDRSKIRIHFERVWQTRAFINDEQRRLLLETFSKFVKEGFILSHGVFQRKSISCPSDSNSFLIVNHDGTIHKCNGRTLGEETQEGILDKDGIICWDTVKQNKRLELNTFENPHCLSCKILPLCMGPCSQKVLEVGGFSKDICSKNSIDISIKEYLAYEFEMRYYLEKKLYD